MEHLRHLLKRSYHQLKGLNYKQLVQLQLQLRPHLEGVPYWIAAILVALIAVIYSSAFHLSTDIARYLAINYPYILFMLSPICFALSVTLVTRYAPPAGGTGIPKVLSALHCDPQFEAEKVHSYLNTRVATVVMLSSLLASLGAGALGAEGPIVHISACIFYYVGKQFHKLWPYVEHRSWIVAGTSAGIAAAFNAPLAGVVFVLEELSTQYFQQFKTVIFSATIIAGIIAQWLSGRQLFFGYPKTGVVPFSSIPWAILVGVTCGVLAYPFHLMLRKKFHMAFSKYFKTKIGFAAFVGLSITCLAVFVDPYIPGGGVGVAERLLFHHENTASWSLIFGRLIATVMSHLSGVAGGFLAPSIGLGAAIGSKVAQLTNYVQPQLLILVGMAAFLSAIIRAPFTAWVIVMEMTDRHSAIFPLMIASVFSYGTVSFLLKHYNQPTAPTPPGSPLPTTSTLGIPS